jgi:predicted transcriptional regulator
MNSEITNPEIEQSDEQELDAALDRGLADVAAGRVHPIEHVAELIVRWTSKR